MESDPRTILFIIQYVTVVFLCVVGKGLLFYILRRHMDVFYRI